MPIQTPLAIAVFLTIWWIVLFTVLPLGHRSLHEDGETPAGSDPGAPLAPMLLKKAGITTAIAIVVFGAFLLIVKAMG